MARARAATVERQLGRELESLKQQLGQLTELVEQYGQKKGDDVASLLSAKAAEFLEMAKSTSGRIGDEWLSLLDRGDQLKQRASDAATAEYERAEAVIAERPFTSVIAALGIGAVIGWCISRR